MIELLVVGTFVFVAAILIGVFATVLGFVGFLISLPFRILGLAFKALGFLIALPFLAMGGLLALVLGGGALAVGLAIAFVPLLPVIALGALIWWLLKRDAPRQDKRSHASVVS